MIELGPHADYIVWGYAGVAIAVFMLIGYVLWDARRVAARLKRLEAQGVRRRSDGTGP